MRELITREMFCQALGAEPEQDDLERCNCEQAGQIGHLMCGWNYERSRPNFWPKLPDPAPAELMEG